MKRKLAVVGALVLLSAGLIFWRCASRGGDSGGGARDTTGATPTTMAAPAAGARGRIDPVRVARGSLAGTVTDEQKAPIASARVCADGTSDELAHELMRDSFCAVADAQGRYKIEGLLPARYTITAVAKPFRPGVHHPKGDRRKRGVSLAAGEHKTGLDIALRGGGVEITGTVSDLTGGPIARATVWASGRLSRESGNVSVETDEQGAFSLWVAPGDISITAAADGYTDTDAWGRAPGTFELLLTPESSLAGVVVDGTTNQPVPGARVNIESVGFDSDATSNQRTFANERGEFRFTRLSPGRKTVVGRTDRGYGHTEGSVLVGLGQSVDGVVVKLFPAARVAGAIVIAATKARCEDGWVRLDDPDKPDRGIHLTERPDGAHEAEGVPPGTYQVSASCDGYQARDKYEPITVAGKDVTGLVWEVDAGGTVRGRVLAKSGGPIADAAVTARAVGGARKGFSWNHATSAADGQYELAGLAPGAFELEVESERGVSAKDGYKIELAAGATVTKDLVLEDGGTIKGTVVDGEGAPVAGVAVAAHGAARFVFRGTDDTKSDRAGAFTIESVQPGDYRVVALGDGFTDQLRKPGTTDDAKQGERVTVRAAQTSTVKLVIEARSGVIRGSVVDAAGKPVSDAYISVARESDAAGARESAVAGTRWTWGDKPVLTGVDGTFAIKQLSPGKYSVRAYRKGGGEAVVEHVATGSTTRLQIKPTGSIQGTAKREGGPPDDMTVTVSDTSGFHRSEKFYMTRGRYTVRDLPGGHYKIEVIAAGGRKQVEVDLAEGEAKTGVDVELEPLLAITGRIVEQGTTKPVPGIMMFAQPGDGGSSGFSIRMGGEGEQEHITDDAGRFTIKNVPAGKISLFGMSTDYQNSGYSPVMVTRTVGGTATDLGDVPIRKSRLKRGETAGELGVNFADNPPGTPPDKREYKVSFIDPAGPAAKTELRVGDVVVSIDGSDITGANAGTGYSLMQAPPGTRLVLGLARGASVAITLAAP